MSKILRLGTAKTYGGRTYSVYAKVTLDNGSLSIHGVEGPLPNGNALGSIGQLDMDKPQILSLAPGWTWVKLAKFWEVWERWHLNDLRPACEHQRALGWTYATHPGEACPVCGYSLGSAWLKEEVPKEVLDFLEGLPETDEQPAWV